MRGDAPAADHGEWRWGGGGATVRAAARPARVGHAAGVAGGACQAGGVSHGGTGCGAVPAAGAGRRGRGHRGVHGGRPSDSLKSVASTADVVLAPLYLRACRGEDKWGAPAAGGGGAEWKVHSSSRWGEVPTSLQAGPPPPPPLPSGLWCWPGSLAGVAAGTTSLPPAQSPLLPYLLHSWLPALFPPLP